MDSIKNLKGRGVEPSVRGFLVCGYASVVVLLAILVLAGCKMEPELVNTGFIPLGEWTAKEGDSYTITNDTLEYGGWGELDKGTIAKAIDFSTNAGVLIIKITESSSFTVGKYTGIYYSEYTSTSIKLANVWLEGSDGSYYPLETDSLFAALSIFTVDNVSNHVFYWGVYTKK